MIRLRDEWLETAHTPVPRYTSYPTAHSLDGDLAGDVYGSWLSRVDGPFALYAHFPFCSERCTYCACNVIATQHRDTADAYLDLLDRETHAVSALLHDSARVTRLHWGGGTPTYFDPSQLARVMGAVRERFAFDDGAEISIEADPRVTTLEQVRTLRELGFNRLSVGVQDFTLEVQRAIGRMQSCEETRGVIDGARDAGFESVNVDLVYGLPLQDEARIAETMRAVAEMRPDRVAIYGYAHLPQRVPHQRKIDSTTVPGIAERWRLEQRAREILVAAGYVEVGLDHFAVPTDALARATRDRTLHRDFMGYTTERSATLVGLGVSSIGELPEGLAQNVKKLSAYREALDAGRLPVERGCPIDEDDVVRRDVIMRLMCDLDVRYADVERARGVRFEEYFAAELTELRAPGGLVDLGIVREAGGALVVDPAARSLVRNVCRVFDRRGRERLSTAPMSSAV